jgi:amino acid transporter
VVDLGHTRDLPRALYASLLVVTLLQVSLATVAVGRLASARIAAASDHALAEAARLFPGGAGFAPIALAAFLPTASAGIRIARPPGSEDP